MPVSAKQSCLFMMHSTRAHKNIDALELLILGQICELRQLHRKIDYLESWNEKSEE